MNENNDIIQMLRDREDEFHLPLREDSWEKLEAELAAGGAAQSLHAAPMLMHRWPKIWWTVAAVSLLCLLVSVPFFFKKASVDTLPGNQAGHNALPATVAGSPADKQPTGQQGEQELPGRKIVSMPVPSKSVLTSVPVVLPELMPELQLADTTVLLPPPAELFASGEQKLHNKPIGPQPERKSVLPGFYGEDIKRMPQPRLWSFGIQGGSNGLSGTRGGFSHDNPSYSEENPGRPDKPEQPEQPGDENKDPNIQTRAAIGGGSSGGNPTPNYYYRHRLPVTFGFSVRRHLFSQISLETGLTYTYLYSDLLEERKDRAGSQRLHYLGIPLKANWTFYNGKLFSLYASGGGMIEYCVSAVNTMRDLDICRWQPSWNASVGMQVQMIKPWSFYVEPGVSYYYYTNPNIRGRVWRFETIRSAHPLTFNLQVGLRFTY